MKRYRISEMLKNYKWKIATLKMERKDLEEAGGSMTAQYGVEASLPKALNNPSDPVYQEVKRRGKRWEKVRKFEEEVREFQSLLPIITDEREAEVLHWMLEGKSERWIAKYMGLSTTHTNRIKTSIIDRLAAVSATSCNSTNESNGANGSNGSDGAY